MSAVKQQWRERVQSDRRRSFLGAGPMKATGKVSISALQNVEVTAETDVMVSGMNINHNANIAFVAKGTAMAELSAAGQTTVKGALVMIN